MPMTLKPLHETKTNTFDNKNSYDDGKNETIYYEHFDSYVTSIIQPTRCSPSMSQLSRKYDRMTEEEKNHMLNNVDNLLEIVNGTEMTQSSPNYEPKIFSKYKGDRIQRTLSGDCNASTGSNSSLDQLIISSMSSKRETLTPSPSIKASKNVLQLYSTRKLDTNLKLPSSRNDASKRKASKETNRKTMTYTSLPHVDTDSSKTRSKCPVLVSQRKRDMSAPPSTMRSRSGTQNANNMKTRHRNPSLSLARYEKLKEVVNKRKGHN